MASTRWISTHDEGLAEWLKNARRAYQVDRSNVEEPQSKDNRMLEIFYGH